MSTYKEQIDSCKIIVGMRYDPEVIMGRNEGRIRYKIIFETNDLYPLKNYLYYPNDDKTIEYEFISLEDYMKRLNDGDMFCWCLLYVPEFYYIQQPNLLWYKIKKDYVGKVPPIETMMKKMTKYGRTVHCIGSYWWNLNLTEEYFKSLPSLQVHKTLKRYEIFNNFIIYDYTKQKNKLPLSASIEERDKFFTKIRNDLDGQIEYQRCAMAYREMEMFKSLKDTGQIIFPLRQDIVNNYYSIRSGKQTRNQIKKKLDGLISNIIGIENLWSI